MFCVSLKWGSTIFVLQCMSTTYLFCKRFACSARIGDEGSNVIFKREFEFRNGFRT